MLYTKNRTPETQNKNSEPGTQITANKTEIS
jgi:hypothetical protein